MRYRYRVHPASQPDSCLSTVEELDALVNRVLTEQSQRGVARVIDVFNWGADGTFIGISFGVGHRERSFVYFCDERGTEVGAEPGIETTRMVSFGGWQPPSAWTNLTPAGALRAAREYVDTGQRPTGLRWRSEPVFEYRAGYTEAELEEITQGLDGIQY